MTAQPVRPPAVAGRFYPADPAALRAEVRRHLAATAGPPSGDGVTAVVAPPAGYQYSGPVAGSAYAVIAAATRPIRRVVLVGPAHYLPVRGVAASGASAFRTPLGLVPVDADARAAALGLPQVRVDDDAHAPEHSLEVHLPFLQEVRGDVPILPLLVGHAGTEATAEVIDAVWDPSDSLLVLSTDLSHYEDYATARARDAATAAAVVDKRYADVGDTDACGSYPLRGLLAVARRRGLAVTLLDLGNSGGTAGGRDRVVGYGAFALHASAR